MFTARYELSPHKKPFVYKGLWIKGALSSPSVCPHDVYRHYYQWRVSMFLASTWFRIFIVGTSVPIFTRDAAYINRQIRLYTLWTYGACTSRQLRFRSIDWSARLRGLSVMAVRGGQLLKIRTLHQTFSEVAMTWGSRLFSHPAGYGVSYRTDYEWCGPEEGFVGMVVSGRDKTLVVALISDFGVVAWVIGRVYV